MEQEITFKGTPVHVLGPIPELGYQSPNFTLVNQDLEDVDLKSFGNQKKLLNIFVSLDTPVCSASIHEFYKKEQKKSNLVLLNISMDLPFAALRFCREEEELDNIHVLSAFRSSFPKDFGLQMTDGPLKGLLARAVFLLNEENEIIYRQIVPEVTSEPAYDAVFEEE